MKSASRIKACGYFRLSREDGDKAESDSIRNQKMLVEDFAKRKGIKLVDEYVDDGYSGTNFNRPSFLRLMDDINARKINCIIVKDLSRLGRNYIEMGRLIQNIFPSMGVRLIAINDNYDSCDEDNVSNQIIIPFKNLINDAYCRDMSLKIRSQFDMKRRKGQFIGSFATFGYMKDTKDNNHLVIDETAAKIVELIYNLRMDGLSPNSIAAKLDELHIPTPFEYKRMCGANYKSGFKAGDLNGWSVTSIRRILVNEMYTGTMVQGKRRKVNYKVKKMLDVDEKDWVKVKNRHDAIIPHAIFEIVQGLGKKDIRKSPNNDQVCVLSGFVKCADCKQNMVRRSTIKKGKKYYYYHCSTYKVGDGCSSHLISDEKLQEYVLKAIQSNLSLLSDANDLLRDMAERPHDVLGVTLLDKQIEAQTREIEKYNDLKVKLYMDMSDGLISKEEYRDINMSFTTKLDRLNAGLKANQKRKDEKISFCINDIPWIEEFLKYKNIKHLERRIIVALIDSILVYDKTRIEVVFNHREEMEEVLNVSRMAREGIA